MHVPTPVLVLLNTKDPEVADDAAVNPVKLPLKLLGDDAGSANAAATSAAVVACEAV